MVFRYRRTIKRNYQCLILVFADAGEVFSVPSILRFLSIVSCSCLAMSTLEKLRDLLHAKKAKAAGQQQKRFLPEGSLDQILQEIDLSDLLCSSPFRIDHHKIDSVIETVLAEGRKVFAILVDLKLEYALIRFIEYGILDRILPIAEEKKLEPVLDPHERDEFMQRQWQYLAHKFSRRIQERCAS